MLRPKAACFGSATTLYCLSATLASRPDGISARSSEHRFDYPVCIYIPILARPWIMHTCHADNWCRLSIALNLKILGLELKPTRNGVCAAASNATHVRLSVKQFAGDSSPFPCPTALVSPSVVTTLGPYQRRPEGIHKSSSRITLVTVQTFW